MTDQQYMQLAYQLAEKGKGRTSPNPMVGALVVKNNRIIAQGYHAYYGGPHAEVVALKKAGSRARGAKIYVTLEPCGHFGKTPPCLDLIIATGIKEVIIGMKDPNPLMNGKSIARLRRCGIKVKVGFLEKELKELNAAFVKYMTTGKPFVVAKIAETLDGKTATASGESKWITSESTCLFSRRLRRDFDAILVGINTVLKDNPALNAPGKPKITKVILDSRLRIPYQAKLFKGVRPADCILATTKRAEQKKIKYFHKRGFCVIVCPAQRDGSVNLPWLLRELAKKEISSILVEGGAKVIGSMLKAKAVDQMHLYIAPKIFGDQNALSSVSGMNIVKINKTVRLKNIKIRLLKEDLFLQGDVVYS